MKRLAIEAGFDISGLSEDIIQHMIKHALILAIILLTLCFYCSAQIPLTAGKWTSVQTKGFPAEVVGYEGNPFAPDAAFGSGTTGGFMVLGKYFEYGSEPNYCWLRWSWEEDRWDVIDCNPGYHTIHGMEGGHVDGVSQYLSSSAASDHSNSLFYWGCQSGSNTPECVKHTWMFDLQGRTGKDITGFGNGASGFQPGNTNNMSGTWDSGNDKMFLFPNPTNALISANISTRTMTQGVAASATTITFNASSAMITGTNSFTAGQIVTIYSTGSGALPSSFTAYAPYFVSATGLSSSTFELATTFGGTPIVASSAGTSPNDVAVLPAPGYTFQAPVYDSDTGDSWNIGGWASYGGTGCTSGTFQSMTVSLRYSITTSTWTQIVINPDPVNGTPIGRGYAAFAYDHDDQVFGMTGGQYNNGGTCTGLNDLWLLIVNSSSAFASSCSGNFPCWHMLHAATAGCTNSPTDFTCIPSYSGAQAAPDGTSYGTSTNYYFASASLGADVPFWKMAYYPGSHAFVMMKDGNTGNSQQSTGAMGFTPYTGGTHTNFPVRVWVYCLDGMSCTPVNNATSTSVSASMSSSTATFSGTFPITFTAGELLALSSCSVTGYNTTWTVAAANSSTITATASGISGLGSATGCIINIGYAQPDVSAGNSNQINNSGSGFPSCISTKNCASYESWAEEPAVTNYNGNLFGVWTESQARPFNTGGGCSGYRRPFAQIKNSSTGLTWSPLPASPSCSSIATISPTGPWDSFFAGVTVDGSGNPWACWSSGTSSAETASTLYCSEFTPGTPLNAGSWQSTPTVLAGPGQGGTLFGISSINTAAGKPVMATLSGGNPIMAFNLVNKTSTYNAYHANQLFVMEESSGSWSPIPSSIAVPGIGIPSADGCASICATLESLAITANANVPIVAYTEYEAASTSSGASAGYGYIPTPAQLFVMECTGTPLSSCTWTITPSSSATAFCTTNTSSSCVSSLNVNGTAGWAAGVSVLLNPNDGFIYVSWTEHTVAGLARLYVARNSGTSGAFQYWTGSGWGTAGSAASLNNNSSGYSYQSSLCTDSTNLYLAWDENVKGSVDQIFVREFTGSTTFLMLGGALNVDTSTGTASYPACAVLAANTPTVTWQERSMGNLQQIYSKMWTGSAWTTNFQNTSAPIATFSVSSLTFRPLRTGITSPANGCLSGGSSSSSCTFSLTNAGTATLTISSIALTGSNTGDFSFTTSPTSNCGGLLGIGASCTISVQIDATATGPRSAAITFTDNAAGSPQSISLSGVGTTLLTTLTTQEALPGCEPSCGIARTNQGATVGIPIADSAAISSASQLSCEVSPTCQFRVLANWPDGNIKWFEFDYQLASLSAGGTDSSIVLTSTPSGGGNIGSNMAVDNGSTITINTGPCTFTIQKANFDVIHQALCNGQDIVDGGITASSGLVLMGPTYTGTAAGTVCTFASTCATAYQSTNDSSSTCSIEENGPQRTAVVCSGGLKDTSGNIYMNFKERLAFFNGYENVRTTVTLRNASDGASGSFAISYKGYQAFELRLSTQLVNTSSNAFVFANDSGTTSGSFSTTGQSAYLYQGYATQFLDVNYNCQTCVLDGMSDIPRCEASSCTPKDYGQDGYIIVGPSGSTLKSGSSSTVATGLGDVSDNSGTSTQGMGIEIGAEYMDANFPRSLQFMSSGGEIRIGISPDQSLWPTACPSNVSPCQKIYYQSWPEYKVADLDLIFHDVALTSETNSFLTLQYPLIARAPISYYNNAGVFNYPILSPSAEDAYFNALPANYGSSATFGTLPDKSNGSSNSPLINWRFYTWSNGGAGNQVEYQYDDLVHRWLSRGLTGRYLGAKWFARFQEQFVWFRADNIACTVSSVNYHGWACHSPFSNLNVYTGSPSACAISGSVNSSGAAACNDSSGIQPNNYTLAYIDPVSSDNASYRHGHWWSLISYYYMTGDEDAGDVLRDGVYNEFTAVSGNGNITTTPRFSLPWQSSGQNNHLESSGSVGTRIMNAARYWQYLNDTGDSTDAAFTQTMINNIVNVIEQEPCATMGEGVASWPSGCAVTYDNAASGQESRGQSTFRGNWINAVDANNGGRCVPDGTNPINNGGYVRCIEPFMGGYLSDGLWTTAMIEGSTWSNYQTILDIAYGNGMNVDQADYLTGLVGPALSSSTLIYTMAMDQPNSSSWTTSGVSDVNGPGPPMEGIYNAWCLYLQTVAPCQKHWENSFINRAAGQSFTPGDNFLTEYGSHVYTPIVNLILNPPAYKLINVPATWTCGSSSCTLHWIPPSGTILQYYLKTHASKTIVDNIGWNQFTNQPIGDPSITRNWFAQGTDQPSYTASQPSPSASSITVSGGTTSQFMLKALTNGTIPLPAAPSSALFAKYCK